MSDLSQTGPVTRLSRRTLRERAAQLDAEKVATGPVEVSEVIDITELNTAPTEAAPVSRVVRRSTTQMVPKRAEPPSPPVITPPAAAPVVEIAEPATEAPKVIFEPVTKAAPATALDVPPWEAITGGAVPAEVTEPVKPSQRTEKHATRSAEAERVPPPSAGYTWVQYLILIAVAFVLGLLLWQIISGEIQIPHGVSDILGWPRPFGFTETIYDRLS